MATSDLFQSFALGPENGWESLALGSLSTAPSGLWAELASAWGGRAGAVSLTARGTLSTLSREVWTHFLSSSFFSLRFVSAGALCFEELPQDLLPTTMPPLLEISMEAGERSSHELHTSDCNVVDHDHAVEETVVQLVAPLSCNHLVSTSFPESR